MPCAWKITEILILRHQLLVLQRQPTARPKLAWPDRALLAALVGVIPKGRRHRLRLLVAPGHDPALADLGLVPAQVLADHLMQPGSAQAADGYPAQAYSAT